MELKARTFNPATVKTDNLILVISIKGKLSENAAVINQATQGLVDKIISSDELKKQHSVVSTFSPNGIAANKLTLINAGNAHPSEIQFIKLAAKIASLATTTSNRIAALCLDDGIPENRDANWCALQIATALEKTQYKSDACKSKQQDKPALRKLMLQSPSSKASTELNSALTKGIAIAAGINLARELGDMPANLCTPTYLSKRARALARATPKLTTRILSEKDMKDLKMGSLLSVTAGTNNPAQMIIMEYKGAAKSKAPVALVGKGVTFDSGGISLKSGGGMDEMKYDMCGAASVFGAILTATQLELPINLVAVIPAVENMPSGNATKPGDIVTSMSGQTIEVLNTDAEGRLILCDALTYVERFKPAAVIDIATLTGACVVALGHHASGLFSNNDDLADELLACGEKTTDRAWRMPIWDSYNQQLKSNFADIANIGGRGAGSITAACFLSRFTKKYPWAHLDTAGTAWNSGAHKGATGRPVALLVEYLCRQAN